MKLLEIFLLTTGVWRLCRLLIEEDGPFGILIHWRRLIGAEKTPIKEGSLADLLTCYKCLSFWLAILAMVCYLHWPWWTVCVATVLTLSAGAIFLSYLDEQLG